jgi:hypothetical protein
VKLLNEAWVRFWENPDSFREWEQDAIASLHSRLGLQTKD